MENLDWVGAGLVFMAVALSVGSLILLWEGIQAFRRQRSAAQAMKKIHGQGVRTESQQSILRGDSERQGLEGLAADLADRLPHRADVQRRLEQAGVAWSPGTYLLLSLGFAAGLFLATLLLVDLLFAAVFGALGFFLPRLYVSRKKAKRIAAFEEAFPDALDLMTRSIRAGHAFATGVEVVAEEAEEPVRSEFRQIFEENRFGLPLDESLLALADRVDMVDVRLFVTSILIQRESGGNLAEKLKSLSALIRARFKFRRQVKIHTAHGRMTGTVLGLTPIFVGVLLYLVNPEYMEPLIVEPAGRALLLGAVLLMGAGFLVIRRITDIQY